MTFTWQEVGLVAIAGLLLGWVSRRPTHTPSRDKLIAQLVGAVLEPTYFWLDLRGPDQRPSNSKVAYLATLVVLLAGVVTFGLKELQQEGGAGLSLNYVAYVTITCFYSLGPKTFHAFLATKLGDKISDVTRARASGAMPAPSSDPGGGG